MDFVRECFDQVIDENVKVDVCVSMIGFMGKM